MSLVSNLRWLRRSSTLRLTLLLSLIFAVAMMGSTYLALTLSRESIFDRIDQTLLGIARTVDVHERPADSASVIVRPMGDLSDLPRPFARAAARRGGNIDLSRDFRGADDWRAIVTLDAQGVPILVAVPLEQAQDTLQLLGGIFWTTTALVLGLTLSTGIAAGLLAQRRVRRINDTLGSLAAGNLKARTGATRSVDDLDDIAQQLDTAAGELERLVAQTRHLSASIAHDLRTPLARLRARLEMLPEGDERGAALEEATRLSGIFDTIMRVAKIEASQGSDGFQPVDLNDLCAEIAEIFGPVVEDAGKLLILDQTGAGTVEADRQMLVQALANLIQNAIVHGGDQVTLFTRHREIGIADNGPGVDPSQYAEIVKPMVRLDAARASDGTGLGLALVRAVADRHGADLILAPSRPTGLKASLKFAKM